MFERAPMSERTGRCLCGAVTFTATTPDSFNVCHCDMCRRWTGGPLMAVNCGSAVRLDGELLIHASSEWAERANCARCGSALFYRLKPTDEHFVALGAFDEQTGWQMAKEIFIDRRPCHYAFANLTTKMTEAEVIAASETWETH